MLSAGATVVQCFDFNQYTTNTRITDNPSFGFANGALDISLNAEALAAGVNARVVWPSNDPVETDANPIAYEGFNNVANGCNMSSPAGIGIFPEPVTKSRDTLTESFGTVSFTFKPTANDSVTWFSVDLVDYGDYNPITGNTNNYKVVLEGFDAASAMTGKTEWDLAGIGGTAGCVQKSMLVSAPIGETFKKIDLAFSYKKKIGGSRIKIDRVVDPNFGIARVCFPGAEKAKPKPQPKPKPKPSVKNDPHFVGFDGSRYDFQGEPGSIFNLITDTHVQVNAKFVTSPIDHKTYMGELGVTLGEDNVVVSAQSVAMNGKRIGVGTQQLSKGGFVVVSNDKVMIMAYGFSFSISTSYTKRVAHLDFVVTTTDFINPHGLLGQTAQYIVKGAKPSPVKVPHHNFNSVGFIDGSAVDYLVSDGILGTAFKFNRFDRDADRKNAKSRAPAHEMIVGSAVYETPSVAGKDL